MPQRDQTGPEGLGPRTGRGMGSCPSTPSEASDLDLQQPKDLDELLALVKQIAKDHPMAKDKPDVKNRLSVIYHYAKRQVDSGAPEKDEVSLAYDDVMKLLGSKDVSPQYRPSRASRQSRLPSYMTLEDGNRLGIMVTGLVRDMAMAELGLSITDAQVFADKIEKRLKRQDWISLSTGETFSADSTPKENNDVINQIRQLLAEIKKGS